MMPAITLAAEVLADFLRFLSEWTAADRIRLADSLAQFMGDHPYELDMLRHDLVRFRELLDVPGVGAATAADEWDREFRSSTIF